MLRVAKIYLKKIVTLRGKKKVLPREGIIFWVLTSLWPRTFFFFFLIRKKTLVPLLFPEARGWKRIDII